MQAEQFLELNTKTEGRILMRDHEVIYIFHNVIDKMGDAAGTEAKTFDAVEQAFEELDLIIKKVANINGSNMLLTADHGFLFQQDHVTPDDATPLPVAGEWTFRNRRFSLGRGIAVAPKVKIFDSAALGVGGDWSAAFPCSLGRFPLQGSGKRYVHGGLSLQEVVVPVVRIHKARSDDTGRVEVELLRVPAKITTGQLSIALYQDRPAAGKVLPRTVRIGVFAKDGTSLSELKTLTFDSSEAEARQRETTLLLVLSATANAFNNCEVDIRLEETVQAVIEVITRRQEDAVRASKSEERAALQKELDELRARQWLQGIVDDVDMEIQRLKKLQALQSCVRDVATDAITRKSTELTNEFVTERLKQAFVAELRAIGLTYVGIGLDKTGGQYGVSRYRVQLENLQQDARVPDVLSEGEFRAVALSAFLAELATAPTMSGLVFDDPVSSLDHHWRQRMARRLAREATVRQVVVFTHDIVFLHALTEEADALGCPVSMSHLVRTRSSVGICLDDVPWIAMKTAKRLGFLKARHQDAAATFKHGDKETYERQACWIYGRLRETWERAIEEVLFGQVVQRFTRAVQTQRLRYTTDITDEDVRIVDASMSKCSTFMDGHDQPAAVNDPVPEPDELAADIAALDGWVTSINKRRK